jgi:hypothetical protein
MIIDQLIIAATGPISIWLVNDERTNYRKWGTALALASQPAWVWAAIEAGQWGILFIELFYIYGWYRGFRNQWLKPKASAIVSTNLPQT